MQKLRKRLPLGCNRKAAKNVCGYASENELKSFWGNTTMQWENFKYAALFLDLVPT
jgi:hypothetical protein